MVELKYYEGRFRRNIICEPLSCEEKRKLTDCVADNGSSLVGYLNFASVIGYDGSRSVTLFL